MPWSDELTPEERRVLRGRFPHLDDAAAAVIKDPRYAKECEQLGVSVKKPARTDARGRRVPPGIHGPQGVEADFVLLVREALLENDEPTVTRQPGRRSGRGRRKGKVSIYEANLAAEIYVKDRAEYDSRDDGGAYAIHKLYSEDREPAAALLSRPMIGHLLTAIRAGGLPWDARKGRLRISDEFRTSKGMFVIPRP